MTLYRLKDVPADWGPFWRACVADGCLFSAVDGGYVPMCPSYHGRRYRSFISRTSAEYARLEAVWS